MRVHRQVHTHPGIQGFSLVEMVIAIAVIAVTFIGIIGLLGLGVANDQISSQQTVANNIAASILADLRSTPTYSATGVSTRFKLTLPTANPGTATAPFAGVAPSYYLYFDNSANWLPAGGAVAYTSPQAVVPAGSAFIAAVYKAQVATVGTASSSIQSTDMVRIVIFWPAISASQFTAGLPPAGSVDVISEFLIH